MRSPKTAPNVLVRNLANVQHNQINGEQDTLSKQPGIRSSSKDRIVNETTQTKHHPVDPENKPGPDSDKPPGHDHVPPTDRGYAWVVLAASLVIHVTFGFMIHAFSVLYAEMVDYFNTTWAAVGWIGSVHLSSLGFFGLPLSILVTRLGYRYSCMLGGVVIALGLLLSSLLVSVEYMFMTYGIITGGALGMPLLTSTTMVQRYFVRHRSLANGARTMATSIGGLCGGPVMRFLIDTYGLKGALIIVAGIQLHTVLCGALFRDINLTSTPAQDKSPSLRHTFSQFASNRILMIFYSGIFVQALGVTMFYQHVVNFAIFIGISKSMAALMPLGLNVGITIGGLVFGFVSNLRGYNRIVHAAVMHTIKGSIIIGLIFVTNFPVLMTLIALSGFIGGSLFTVETTNMADFVPIETFVVAQAVLQMMFGVSTIIGVPLAGYLADVTSSYKVALAMSGGLQSLAAIFYVIIKCLRNTEKNSKYEMPIDTSNIGLDSTKQNEEIESVSQSRF